MNLYDHQKLKLKEALAVIKKYGLVYLHLEEQTGKTLIALEVAKASSHKNILVLTKKGKCLQSWKDTLAKHSMGDKNVVVTNWHQASKITKGEFTFFILDESHNYIASFPKQSKMFKTVVKLTCHKGNLITYCSATPAVKSPNRWYHQLALSYYSPYRKYKLMKKDANAWFRDYGIPKMGKRVIVTNGIKEIKTFAVYDEVRLDAMLPTLDKISVRGTREQLMNFKYEPTDKIVTVAASPRQKMVYNRLLDKRTIPISLKGVGTIDIVCDTPPRLNSILHQIEGGTIKLSVPENLEVPEQYRHKHTHLDFKEHNAKLNWLLENYPTYESREKVGVYYQYIKEGEILRKFFPNVYQYDADSEGFNLTHLERLVFYSQNYSTTKYIQSRARQTSMKRQTPIEVIYLIIKGGIGEQIYKTVAEQKIDFSDKLFEREEL